jgi:multiple sugar transport system ATP-binding protein
METEGGAECTARLPRGTHARVDETVEFFFRSDAAFLFDPQSTAAIPALSAPGSEPARTGAAIQ